MITELQPEKAHVFHTDRRRIAVHTEKVIGLGSLISLRGVTRTVKEVTREQKSSYFADNFYYELKV